MGLNSFNAKQVLKVDGRDYCYYSLPHAAKDLGDISHLPYSLRVLLENLLRQEDGQTVTKQDIIGLANWGQEQEEEVEIAYHPARVVMQDFTGVPAVVDLAVMRDAVKKLQGNPLDINPQVPVDLVIDHSVQVDYFGHPEALEKNMQQEYLRNEERYQFLKWGAKAFKNFRVVPPGVGIIHQVNLEYLAQVVWVDEAGQGREQAQGMAMAYCDTCVGTDSHTTMINGLSVLGWGVGGIEAEAAMLGRPVTMKVPAVVGFYLSGELREGVTATDLVLQIVQMLRAEGVVGKFVEFYGPGLAQLKLADRATIANMAPEYGATCGFFPIDAEAINYLRFTGREESRVRLVEEYAKAQGLWWEEGVPDPQFSARLELAMGEVVPCLAGHKRPQDRIPLEFAQQEFHQVLSQSFQVPEIRQQQIRDADYQLKDGDVVIAAITSCTNTSNPAVMVAAGMVARNAIARGLQTRPWVKTSLAPGSQVVEEYLDAAGLLAPLAQLGFHVVGHGCTTCIGNSGPLPGPIVQGVEAGDLVVASVLSGNRNFEGRISPHVKANFLASPPLVVAYALAGTMDINLREQPIGVDRDGQSVFLKDLWPSNREIRQAIEQHLSPQMFKQKYANVFKGEERWQQVQGTGGETYNWNEHSSYIQCPPYFEGMSSQPPPLEDIKGARLLAILGASVTTDHISPAGAIAPDSPAGEYLLEQGVSQVDFNSYGSRRGNHQVMMRGTFANIRLRNEMVPGTEGGLTRHWQSEQVRSIFATAMKYQQQQTPLVVVAGSEYGTGSSRDWAAKGTNLLGVRAVIAESFERIHRSNLIGMGVLPLQLTEGIAKDDLKLEGAEIFDIIGIAGMTNLQGQITLGITRKDGRTQQFPLICRIETQEELNYYRHGGILHYVLRNLEGK